MMRDADRAIFVVGLVLLFGGLNLVLLLSHMSRLFGAMLVLAGVLLLLWSSRGAHLEHGHGEGPRNMASRLVRLFTFGGKFRHSLPLAGLGVLSLVMTYNIFVSRSPYLGSNDYVSLFLAGVLISYNYVPRKYLVERDFALLFALLLFVLLVIPTTILQFTSSGEDTNSPITYILLAAPTASLARLLGVPVTSPFMDAGIPVYNHMEIIGADGLPMILHISLSCSGLYSVAIFVSAFIAYIAVEHGKFDRKAMALLGAGIFLAWLANIIRMTLIVLVGHHRGAADMVWVHNNIGELIFMAWVILFWLLMFRVLGAPGRDAGPRPSLQRKRSCAVCGEPLSPTIPSARCECGAISHSGCLLTEGMRCPSCGVSMEADFARD